MFKFLTLPGKGYVFGTIKWEVVGDEIVLDGSRAKITSGVLTNSAHVGLRASDKIEHLGEVERHHPRLGRK